MMSCHRLIWLLLMMMLAITCASESLFRSPRANGTRWELLEAAANQIRFNKSRMLSIQETYRFDLWNRYNSSSRSQRREVVNEISETLKEVAAWSSRFDMVGVMLFSSEKGHLLLNLGLDKRPELVDPLDHFKCVGVIDRLLIKHCGPRSFNGLRHLFSPSNICYFATKEMIEEAVILSCGVSTIEPVASKWLPFDLSMVTLQSYVCSPWTMLAVAFCLALYYAIGFIIASIL